MMKNVNGGEKSQQQKNNAKQRSTNFVKLYLPAQTEHERTHIYRENNTKLCSDLVFPSLYAD